jgi:tripartite-type tricarboxylate transporter receptor subunit TctC
MKNITRQAVRGLMAAVMLSVTATAVAEKYPSRDITFVVPYGPGGGTDPISRQFTSQLAKIMGGSVNVENKPGGSATIGTGAVITARPDGYTIGLGTNGSLAYQPLVNRSLTYKSTDDYQPIAKLVDLPTIVIVRADAPWKTFDEFMADVKKNPGKIRASVSGLRSATELAVQQLNKVAGVKITTVPFTGGAGEALVALLGGRVEASVISAGPGALGFSQAGKVRMLAVFQKGKHELYPDASSVVDAGYDVTLPAMYCVIAPKGLPKDVHDKLVNASLQVARSDEFLKFAKANGYVVDAKGPEKLKLELAEYTQTFTELNKFLDQK